MFDRPLEAGEKEREVCSRLASHRTVGIYISRETRRITVLLDVPCRGLVLSFQDICIRVPPRQLLKL